ncbi:hypothetical protein F5146DRAFT_1046093 [Armillaria mellea]|nr:hypothetical protein F5146DRAFT_1046093 [Armillaria mellea]
MSRLWMKMWHALSNTAKSVGFTIGTLCCSLNCLPGVLPLKTAYVILCRFLATTRTRMCQQMVYFHTHESLLSSIDDRILEVEIFALASAVACHRTAVPSPH